MKALVLNALRQPLDFQEVELKKAKKEEAIVELRAAALNHRDVFIQKGLYANIVLGSVLGSDGAGVCEGRNVLICPSIRWGRSAALPGPAFRVLGMPDAGTFAQAIAIERANVFPMPAHLSFEEGAALPLAGLTSWRAVFSKCKLKKGEKILISGIGGGVALMAHQWAVAIGASVFVTSSSVEKIDRAISLGALGGADYRVEGWDKLLKKESGGGFDVIIDSAGGDGFAALVGLLKPGGRLATYGGTQGKINGLSPQILFWKQLSIFGSSMGSPLEFGQMLRFVERHELRPVVDSVFALSDGNAALEKMERGEQFGKIVLKIA